MTDLAILQRILVLFVGEGNIAVFGRQGNESSAAIAVTAQKRVSIIAAMIFFKEFTSISFKL